MGPRQLGKLMEFMHTVLVDHSDSVFVTGNRMKLQEVRYILSQNTDIELTSQDLDGSYRILHIAYRLLNGSIVSVPEIQGTTEEVAIEKCRRAAEILQGPCITEDTALCFEALNGLPGPYIKHFMKKLGLDGQISLNLANRTLIHIPYRIEHSSRGVPI